MSKRMAGRRRALFAALVAVAAISAPGVQAQGLSGAYLAGRQAATDKEYARAAEFLTRALTRDPSNPMLLDGAVQSQLALGNVDRAVPIARKIEADGLRSQLAQMALVADHIVSEDYTGLLARIGQDRAVGPLVDGLMTAWANMGTGAVRDALDAFDKLGQERGLAGFSAYHKALALASVGDFDSAEAIFAADPTNPLLMTRRGLMARLAILSQLDRGADALAVLDELFGTDLDPGLQAMREGLVAGARLPFDTVRSPRDGMAEVFHTVAAALASEADDDYTLLYSRIAVHIRPDHVDAVLSVARLLEGLNQFDLAVETYRGIATDHPAYYAAALGQAEALRRAERLDEASDVLDALAKSHANMPVVHVTAGDLFRQKKEFAAASAAYTRALDLYSEVKPEQWFIFYARAITHERQDMWPEAEADFRRALELNPEQPQVLNYLGYSLVEKQTKLDEALDMIERAVAARPDSGYIVDSLGWVLYRLGRYDDAVGHMERATELMPVDPVVNDHLGDVYWAVGRYREAEFQWKRALSFHGTGETSDDVDPDRLRRKLEVGLDQVLTEEGSPPLQARNGN